MKALITLASMMSGSSSASWRSTDVLLEGLVSPLLAVAKIPGVPWAGVGTLEVANEDQTEVALAADATELELLKPTPCWA
jgi:hypothetical protein